MKTPSAVAIDFDVRKGAGVAPLALRLTQPFMAGPPYVLRLQAMI